MTWVPECVDVDVVRAEDEEMGEVEEDDDEPINPLVDALFDEVEKLRMQACVMFFLRNTTITHKDLQLFESEMRCAIIEAETREEVMKEMDERMRSVERMYARRLMNEVSMPLFVNSLQPFSLCNRSSGMR